MEHMAESADIAWSSEQVFSHGKDPDPLSLVGLILVKIKATNREEFMVLGSEFTLTLDSCGLSLLARDFVMVAVKKYTLLLWVECPSAHTTPCKQNLLAFNAKSLSRFPGFLIQLTSLQMASLALRTLRIAARNQQPLFYIAQVKSDIKEVTKSLSLLFYSIKEPLLFKPAFLQFFCSGEATLNQQL